MGLKIKDVVIARSIDVKELAGKIIAIDGPNTVMQFLKYKYKNKEYYDSEYIIDRTRRVISHLYGLLYRMKFFYAKKMLPIVCFDGRVHPFKRRITKNQLHDFLYVKKQYETAIEEKNFDKAQAIATGKEFMWINAIQESKKLLGYMGVPYIDSPSSAEAQCVQLAKAGIVDVVVSQDYDSVVLGCPTLIRNLSKSRKRKIQNRWQTMKVNVEKIDLRENLKSWGVDIFQLVDMAILIGNDFNQGVRGIGPKNALNLIRQHGNVESVVKRNRDKYDFTGLNKTLIDEVREIFLFPEVITKHSDFNWNYPKIDKLTEFLCEDHHLNKKRVEDNAVKLEYNYKRCINYFAKNKNKSNLQKGLLSYI